MSTPASDSAPGAPGSPAENPATALQPPIFRAYAAGMMAARLNKSLAEKPFPKGSAEMVAYLRGYQQVQLARSR